MLADAPSLPRGTEDTWRDFMAMHNCRSMSGFGAAAISYRDMDAYQSVEGFRLTPWQIKAIKRADAAYLEQKAKDAKAKAVRK